MQRTSRVSSGRALAALVLAIGIPTGCAASPAPCDPAAPPQAMVDGYRLGPGDLARVTVFRQPDLSGEFRLDGDADLALPLAGELRAGELTTRELEQAIAARLRDAGYLVNPQASVQVLTYRPFYIVGEVRRPGLYEYRNGLTVINAVALAGGFSHRARASGTTVDRGGCAMPAGRTPWCRRTTSSGCPSASSEPKGRPRLARRRQGALAFRLWATSSVLGSPQR